MPIKPIRPVAGGPTVSAVPRPRIRPAPPSPTPLDYAVGYKRPPPEHRFAPGQSGNPRGRPRGARGLKVLARAILTEKVTVRLPDGPKRMTKMEAMIHKIAERAFAGELRALQSLVQLYRDAIPDEPMAVPVVETSEESDASDRAILEALRLTLTAKGEQP